ncbi:MAG TPA: WhiB family transcriptional regulator [Candidatus Limnocylindria bacterium]
MTALRDWRELAKCRNTATARYDPFFDETEQGERAAIAICRTCRVQGECLAYAVRTGQSYGVWGGRPQQELRRLIALDRLGRAQVRTSRRHRNATKDRCEHGHRFDAANTYYTPTGERRCRICRRAVDRARERRRRHARQLARQVAELRRVRRQGGAAGA